jgi:IMP dehydrogenase
VIVVIEGLSLDDIILTPRYNRIKSRLDTDVKTKVSRRHGLDIPIVSTNMSTITEYDMAKEMGRLGGSGILHRFMPTNQNYEMAIRLQKDKIKPVISSVGVGDEELKRAYGLLGYSDVLLIDVAHADAESVFDQLHAIKTRRDKFNKDTDIIVGNIATYEAARTFMNQGADGVRVGIGGGSRCQTREVTGHGVPNLTALMEVVRARNDHKGDTDIYIPVIMDGGIKNSGDIVKSLYFGADAVSLGNLVAGTDETPGETFRNGDGLFKKYYGMASKEAQDTHRNGIKKGTTSEGFSAPVPYKGKVSTIIDNLVGGIRSGLTYSGAKDIYELRMNGRPIRLSPASQYESKLR